MTITTPTPISTSAMSQINGVMPTPGTGTSTSTPQEVLFIVSDGVEDDNSGVCSETLDGTRCQAPFDTTWCTTIKNRGIRIAVLYTQYLPLTTNSWYNTWISPWQNEIATNMQSCASSGLYFSITTDGDITAAMQALFQSSGRDRAPDAVTRGIFVRCFGYGSDFGQPEIGLPQLHELSVIVLDSRG